VKKKIIVVGGGVTGLSAANRIVELSNEHSIDIEIVLLESSEKLGGNISTVEKDGFLVEEGPDSFITTKPWALNLTSRLGLDDELMPTNEENRRTFILRGNELVPLPEGFLMLAPTQILPFITTPLFSWRGKLRMLMDLVIPGKKPGDESLASFVRRRLGDEALDRVAQPMISGVYTADPEKLSLRATMPQFLEMEENYGSVIKGMYQAVRKRGKHTKSDSGARYSMFVTFRKGMKTLVDALEKNLPAGSIRLGEKVSEVAQTADGWEVKTGEDTLSADGVIITTPSYAAAGILANTLARGASLLEEIEYASSAVVILAYKKSDISSPLDGFGFVVPRIENKTLIACSYSSEKFSHRAPEDSALFRAFVGGAISPEKYQMNDSEILESAQKELAPLLGIKSAPVISILKRYPGSMPQYRVGHLELVGRIRAEISKHKGLELAGNAYGGVGIPDCVNSGELAAERLFQTIHGEML